MDLLSGESYYEYNNYHDQFINKLVEYARRIGGVREISKLDIGEMYMIKFSHEDSPLLLFMGYSPIEEILVIYTESNSVLPPAIIGAFEEWFSSCGLAASAGSVGIRYESAFALHVPVEAFNSPVQRYKVYGGRKVSFDIGDFRSEESLF